VKPACSRNGPPEGPNFSGIFGISATGKILWQKNLREEFDGVPGTWAYAESPLVDGEKVVVTPGGEKATVAAMNKENGDVIWTCAVPGADPAAYASIIVVHAAGRKQYVQFMEKGLIGVLKVLA
jgi:outer membrane protein assembly factor BamB